MANFDDLNNAFGENKTPNGQGGSNPVKVILIIIFSIIIIAYLASSCADSGSSGGGSNSSSSRTCQFDGCSAPAVGPTYEFCAYHKKMLNEVWDAENRQGK